MQNLMCYPRFPVGFEPIECVCVGDVFVDVLKVHTVFLQFPRILVGTFLWGKHQRTMSKSKFFQGLEMGGDCMFHS